MFWSLQYFEYLQTDNQKALLKISHLLHISVILLQRELHEHYTYLIKMEACESVPRAKSAPELLSDSKNVRFLSEYFVLERLSLKNDWKSNYRYF